MGSFRFCKKKKFRKVEANQTPEKVGRKERSKLGSKLWRNNSGGELVFLFWFSSTLSRGDGWSRNSMSQVAHLVFVAVFLSIHACTPSHIIQDQKRPRSENSLLEKGWIRNRQYDRIISTEGALRLPTTFDNINHSSHPIHPPNPHIAVKTTSQLKI